MWKPVRLQGAGAATIINAVKRPHREAGRVAPQGQGSGRQPGRSTCFPVSPTRSTSSGRASSGRNWARASRCSRRTTARSRRYPSRIDGFTITGADGGGGIFVNGYAHNLEISNNRVYGQLGAAPRRHPRRPPVPRAAGRRTVRVQPQPEHPPQRDHPERRSSPTTAPAAACRCARAPTITPSPETSSAATSARATAPGLGTWV